MGLLRWAKGASEVRQARQLCSKRRPVDEFEPGHVFGMKHVTIKIPIKLRKMN